MYEILEVTYVYSIPPGVMDNFPDKMFWIGLKSFIKSFSLFYCSEL